MNRSFSRRSLFNLGFLKPESLPEKRNAKRFGQDRPRPYLRPPKAIEETQFLESCTGCEDCAAACPYNAIVKLDDNKGTAAGSPIIDPSNAACMMCEDMPCVAACGEGALIPELPARMGRALIQKHDCLAWTGSFCSSCAERCPIAGAITMDSGKPTLHAEICIGCGVCHHVCPAPRNAVLILPELARPRSPEFEEVIHE